MSKDKKDIVYTGDHHFNVAIANDYGVDVAIFLKNMYFLTQYVVSNDKNFYDQNFWIYNKLEAFKDYLPYYSLKQIRRIINKALQNDLIEVGNYNKHKYDKTKWYSLTPKALAYYPDLEQKVNNKINSLSPNGQMDKTTETAQNPPNTAPLPNRPNGQISNDAESKENTAQNPPNPTPDVIRPNGQMVMPKQADANAQMGTPYRPNGQTYTNKIESKIVNNNNNGEPVQNSASIENHNSEPVVVFDSLVDHDLVQHKNQLPAHLQPSCQDHEFLKWSKFHVQQYMEKEQCDQPAAIAALKKLMTKYKFEKPKGFVDQDLKAKQKAQKDEQNHYQEIQSKVNWILDCVKPDERGNAIEQQFKTPQDKKTALSILQFKQKQKEQSATIKKPTSQINHISTALKDKVSNL